MHKFNRFAFTDVSQFCADLVFLIFSFLAAYLIASVFSDLYDIGDYLWVMVIYIPIWLFSMAGFKMYNCATSNYFDRIFRSVALSTIFAGISVIILFYYIRNNFFSRRLFSFLIVCTILLLILERYVLMYISKKYIGVNKKVLIIGNDELIDKFEYYLKKTQININIVGYMALKGQLSLKYGHAGNIDQMYDFLRDKVVDEVIFTLPGNFIEEVRKYIVYCEEMGLTVSVVIDLYGLKLAKTYVSSVGVLPMLTFHTISLNNVQNALKRAIDIIGAVVGLVITGLVSVAAIPLIKLDSPGPVFFKQERVGLNGRHFHIYKFRSMYIGAEAQRQDLMMQNQVKNGLMFKIKHDPRVTRVGRILRKTSLDELPQFWNVLKGDMSLVGTRPPTLDEVSQYQNSQRRRLSIKPGLTGLWQVSGRSSITDFDEVVKLDINYIDNWSIIGDFKLILKTIPAVLKRRGAM